MRVAEAKFNGGESSELDLQQAATLVGQTEAQIPRLQNTVNQTKSGLAVLLGTTPDDVDRYLGGSKRIPVASARVAVGIPHDLLRRRPDVRVAGLNAAAQSALIGVSQANMYPALSLAGAFGFSSNNRGREFAGGHVHVAKQGRPGRDFAGSGRSSTTDGLINQVRVQDAAFQQAVLNYQNTVLNAQQEVENGLSAFYTEMKALASLTTAATAARRSTELSLSPIQSRRGRLHDHAEH